MHRLSLYTSTSIQKKTKIVKFSTIPPSDREHGDSTPALHRAKEHPRDNFCHDKPSDDVNMVKRLAQGCTWLWSPAKSVRH